MARRACSRNHIRAGGRAGIFARARRFAPAVLAVCLAVPAAAASVLSSPFFPPGLFDPHSKPPKPEPGALRTLRFLTSGDYFPFHYETPDGGALAGFDVELARAICETLKLTCTIQARRFDTLIDSLEAGEGDAIIGAIRIDAKSRERLDFSAPYAKNPARFVRPKDAALPEATPEALRGKFIGVIGGSAHEAYLDAYFKGSLRKTYDSRKSLAEALKNGAVDVIFGDGLALSLWLQSPAARGCCAFSGGPFLDAHFFGDGVGIAFKKGNPQLRQALNYALADLSAKGGFVDLYLKYFPIGYY